LNKKKGTGYYGRSTKRFKPTPLKALSHKKTIEKGVGFFVRRDKSCKIAYNNKLSSLYERVCCYKLFFDVSGNERLHIAAIANKNMS